VVSRAGAGYAALWIAVTAARLWFAYAAQHEFPVQLGHFLAAHQLSATALTNAFIFLSIGMDLFRSVLLAGRSWGVRSGHPAAAAANAGLPTTPAASPAGQPLPGRPWASDLLSIPLLLVGGRLNRQLDRRQDRLDRRARRRL
jgi:hypothetical protein